VVYPLANLLATEQVHLGDLVCIDWDRLHTQLTFAREGEGALVSPEVPQSEKVAAVVEAKDGKSAEPPAEVVQEEKRLRVASPAATPSVAPQGRKKPER